MAITPVEIRHIQLSKGFRGYRAAAVERLLADIAEDFEEVWRQRADLADKVEQLENDLQRHRELEGLLRSTLVSAERSAQELKDQARRDADSIVAEAHGEARAVDATRGRRARAARPRGAPDHVAAPFGARRRVEEMRGDRAARGAPRGAVARDSRSGASHPQADLPVSQDAVGLTATSKVRVAAPPERGRANGAVVDPRDPRSDASALVRAPRGTR